MPQPSLDGSLVEYWVATCLTAQLSREVPRMSPGDGRRQLHSLLEPDHDGSNEAEILNQLILALAAVGRVENALSDPCRYGVLVHGSCPAKHCENRRRIGPCRLGRHIAWAEWWFSSGGASGRRCNRRRHPHDGRPARRCRMHQPRENTCPIIGVCKLSRVLKKATRAFMDLLHDLALADIAANRGDLLSRIAQLEKGIVAPMRKAQ